MPGQHISAMRLAAGEMPQGARQWTDRDSGWLWNALTLLELRAGERHTVDAQRG
jgi:hypothetical protein